MTAQVDLYDSTYTHFTEDVLEAIRREAYGQDIGQNGWLTVDEYQRLLPRLGLAEGRHLLEVAIGSGGPALYVARTTGCRVTGIDINESGIATANAMAAGAGLEDRVRFLVADATTALPFEDGSFDALVCIDAMNHFPPRQAVLREWHRVLRPGGRALFTDTVVVTGPVTSEEIAIRASIGVFLFLPDGLNERLIEQAGFRLLYQEDATPNAALTSGRWHDAREARRDALLLMEGRERFEGLQRFFTAVRTLSSERRLSRIFFVLEKPAT